MSEKTERCVEHVISYGTWFVPLHNILALTQRVLDVQTQSFGLYTIIYLLVEHEANCINI